MAQQYKVLYFKQTPWKVGEREEDRDTRVKVREAITVSDCYPSSYPGRVISVIPAAKNYHDGDTKDPTRAVVTLALTIAERNEIASRTKYIGADGKLAAVTFDERWGRIAAVLRDNFDDVEAAEIGSAEPAGDPALFELTDGWRFAELAALNQKMLPKTEVHSGAGLYEVGPTKTYATIQSALDQLFTDQGSATFTASQYIRIFADIYVENVVPNSLLGPDEALGYMLFIEGDPTDNRDNIEIACAGGSHGIYVNFDSVIIRHIKVTGTPTVGHVYIFNACRFSLVDDCVISGSTATQALYIFYSGIVRDCYIENTKVAGYGFVCESGPVKLKRVTLIGPGSVLSALVGVRLNTAEVEMRACVVSGWKYAFMFGGTVLPQACLIYNSTLYDCIYGFRFNAGILHSRFEIKNSIIKDVAYPFRFEAVIAGKWPQEISTYRGTEIVLQNNCHHGYTAFADDTVVTKTHAQFTGYNLVDASGDLDDTDPLLTDPGAGDFSLQVASPCKWAGHGSGVISDYLGTAFDANEPDIGAWSSGAAPGFQPNPNAATAVIVDDETGSSVTITVDADGASDETWVFYSGDQGATWAEWGTSVIGDGDIQVTGLANLKEYYFQILTSLNGAPDLEGTLGTFLIATVTDGTSASWQDVCNIIRSRFKTKVVDVIAGGLPTQYDNDGAFDKPEGTRWCRFSIRPADSMQVEMGDLKRYRTPGVAIAQIFTPVGLGDKDSLVIADTIKTAFRAVTATGVRFKTPSLQVIGRDGDEWAITVTIPFYFDDVI